MAIDDPKTRMQPVTPSAPVTQSDFLIAMQELIKAVKASPDPAGQERALLEAERLSLEHERLKREMPQNPQAPGFSVYSHPEGDLAHPKAPLKARIFWANYELKIDTMTPLEIDLVNRLEPGEYKVTKTDGTSIPFRVAAKVADNHKLEELSIWFPCKGEHKHNHNSMTSYCQQVLGDRVPSLDELQAELARLRAEMAAAMVGAGRV